MADFIDFRPGLRLSVMEGRSMLSTSYHGVVRQVSDEGLRVDWPRNGKETMELLKDDAVTLVVQMHGRMYTCSSKVLDLQEIPSESILLEHPTEVRHNERRQFYRLITSIKPRYAAQTTPDGDEIQRIDAHILDISGGGVQMRSEERIPIGARIRLVFALESDPLQLDVTVMALSIQKPDVTRSFHRVNAKFIDIERDVQERIIRFIFRQQMLLRQKQVV